MPNMIRDGFYHSARMLKRPTPILAAFFVVCGLFWIVFVQSHFDYPMVMAESDRYHKSLEWTLVPFHLSTNTDIEYLPRERRGCCNLVPNENGTLVVDRATCVRGYDLSSITNDAYRFRCGSFDRHCDCFGWMMEGEYGGRKVMEYRGGAFNTIKRGCCNYRVLANGTEEVAGSCQRGRDVSKGVDRVNCRGESLGPTTWIRQYSTYYQAYGSRRTTHNRTLTYTYMGRTYTHHFSRSFCIGYHNLWVNRTDPEMYECEDEFVDVTSNALSTQVDGYVTTLILYIIIVPMMVTCALGRHNS